MSGQFGKNESSSSTQVQIPEFLKPLIGQGTAIAGGTLGRLREMLSPHGDLVAGFDPLQRDAQRQAVEFAGGAGGFLPTAQGTFLDAARGSPLSSFIPEASFNALSSTAAGDFLSSDHFGNQFEAALREISPAVAGQFSAGGIGASTGGLSQVARTRAAADVFGDLVDRERGRQLGAASTLADFGNMERNRQLAAAEFLPSLGLAGINLLSDVGGQRQDLAQRRINAPIDAQLQLLQAALGGVPISSLLGQNTQGQSRGFSFGFSGGSRGTPSRVPSM